MRGFTLIELLIAVLIMGILVSISTIMYRDAARQGRRSDAINTLSSIALAEERYRTTNTQYGSLAQVWGGVTTSTQGFYTLSISNTSATGYTITASAVGDQVNDSASGTSCSTMTLTVSSGTVTKTPAVCWPQ